MIGYDLDGTICDKGEIDKKFFHCNKLERIAFQKCREYHMKEAKLVLKPSEKEFIIITSRKPKHQALTTQWLTGVGVVPSAIYFIDRGRTRTNMIAYKSKFINSLGVTRYYEDDKKIAKALTRKCPNTEIVVVEALIRPYKLKDFLNTCLQI